MTDSLLGQLWTIRLFATAGLRQQRFRPIVAGFCASWMWFLCQTVGTPALIAAEPVQVVRQGDHALQVLIDGREFTVLRTSPDFAKPLYSPLRAADGTALTRALDEAEDVDHPHHKGLWIAQDEVNGLNFWAEKARIVNREVQITKAAGGSVEFVLSNDWVDGERVLLLERTRVAIDQDRMLRFEIEFRRVETDVTFGDTKEGFLALRVLPSMREKVGGLIVNADGQRNEAGCWGKVSPWVDYSGPVAGKTYGFAFLDHPDNFRQSRYHCRAYGLFTISPFGEGAYQQDPTRAQPVQLTAEKPNLKLRYGLVVHDGDAEAGGVAAAYKRYLSRESR